MNRTRWWVGLVLFGCIVGVAFSVYLVADEPMWGRITVGVVMAIGVVIGGWAGIEAAGCQEACGRAWDAAHHTAGAFLDHDKGGT